MFMGSYENSIDAKARMIVPARFRDELRGRCILTRGFDKCLNMYTFEEWSRFYQELKKLPRSNKDARNFIRHMFKNAVECEIDKQGRVTLPAKLREYADLEKELVTVGTGDYIEVWGKAVWDDSMAADDLEGSELAEGMERYGI